MKMALENERFRKDENFERRSGEKK